MTESSTHTGVATGNTFANAKIISGPFKGKTLGEALGDGMQIPLEPRRQPKSEGKE